jgi:hypothetical protein
MNIIPQLIEISPKLREEIARNDKLLEREATVSAKVRQLRGLKTNGALSSNDDSLVQSVLAGEPFLAPDIDAELNRLTAEWRAIEEAKEIQTRIIAAEEKGAGAKLREAIKPTHDKIMVRLCKALVDTHAAYSELFRMKRELAGNGIGLGNLFDADPEFLEIPTDRASCLAEFFREAIKGGFMTTMPKELR